MEFDIVERQGEWALLVKSKNSEGWRTVAHFKSKQGALDAVYNAKATGLE